MNRFAKRFCSLLVYGGRESVTADNHSVVGSLRSCEELTNLDGPVWPWMIAFTLALAVSAADAQVVVPSPTVSPPAVTTGNRAVGEELPHSPAVQEQVIRDKLGNVVRTTLRTDGEASPDDPALAKVFEEARDFARDVRAIQATDGLKVARAKGLGLRTEISSVCNFELQDAEDKDDLMTRSCSEARQQIEQALGELRDEQ